jgi:hypothetical protein
MPSNIWGPKYWKLFHIVSSYYPVHPDNIDKKMGMLFIRTIAEIIPCHKCATHYRDKMQKIKIKNHVQSREEYMKWFVKIHNATNLSLKKKKVSVKDAFDKIHNFSKFLNFTTLLDDTLFYVKHIFPLKGAIQGAKRIAVKNLLYCIFFFTKKSTIINPQFNSRRGFVVAYKNMIKTMKQRDKKIANLL